jgi:membrane-bound lytic murein transglycosylase D
MQKFYLLLIIIFLSSCATLEQDVSILQNDSDSEMLESSENTISENQTIIASNQIDIDNVESNPEKPVVFDNLWDKIPYLYKMPALDDPVLSNNRITSEKDWYLGHADYLYRVSERAQPYLYLIVEQIEQRQLPAELALLPIVESAFLPHAYSRGRAAGLWQFIPGTGKYFGLKQNWWYDGRRDIYAATNAALDYLEQLNKQFDNDWLLTLAAYNAGAGTINKAIKRNKKLSRGTSFWDLDLSKETQAYVPKLLALAQIIKERKENKIKLLAIKNEAYLGLVDSENHIDLAVAAGLANIGIDQLYKYNPGFNQWATDPDGPHHLLLPIDAINTFNKNLELTDKNDLIRWSRYKIKPGDSLNRIAKLHGISINALKKANQLKNSRIRAGKYLVIPVAGKNTDFYSQEVTEQRDKIIAQINSKKRIIYKVKRGDSLWTISRKYRLPYKKLAKINGISPLATLSIGQRLKVWLAPASSKKPYKTTSSTKQLPTAAPFKKTKIKYNVRDGDSLYAIAKRYNVSIKQVVNWNQLSLNTHLQPGQKLVLYVKS